MKRFMYLSISLVAIITLTSFVVLSHSRFGSRPQGARLERILKSPNYKDGAFTNLSVTPTLTDEGSKIKTFLKFFFGKKEGLEPINAIPHIKTDLKRLPPDQDAMVWFGHSSYFLQIDGKKILVDPVFCGHASPFSFMIKAFKGTNETTADDMPDIDYLFITHDHWDHLDDETIRKLQPKIKKVVCGLGVGAHLEAWGIDPRSIIELDWHDQADLGSGFVANATPARHFSGRGLKGNQTLWVSFVLKTPSMNLFIGGDGGYDTHFAQIGAQYGPFDLAILEQGQYDQRWKYIHMLPDEVFKAAEDLKAKRLLPVHHSKFALGAHPWQEPLNLLVKNAKAHQIPVLTPMIGELVMLKDTTQQFTEWW